MRWKLRAGSTISTREDLARRLAKIWRMRSVLLGPAFQDLAAQRVYDALTAIRAPSYRADRSPAGLCGARDRWLSLYVPVRLHGREQNTDWIEAAAINKLTLLRSASFASRLCPLAARTRAEFSVPERSRSLRRFFSHIALTSCANPEADRERPISIRGCTAFVQADSNLAMAVRIRSRGMLPACDPSHWSAIAAAWRARKTTHRGDDESVEYASQTEVDWIWVDDFPASMNGRSQPRRRATRTARSGTEHESLRVLHRTAAHMITSRANGTDDGGTAVPWDRDLVLTGDVTCVPPRRSPLHRCTRPASPASCC